MNLLEEFKKELPMIKQVPLSFVTVCVALAAAEWAVFHFTYSNRIDSKDATIQTLEHERDGYKSEVERLKQNRPVTPDATLTLKVETFNLAKQIDTEVAKWPPGEIMANRADAYRRFSFWIEDVMKRLDRHGQWSDDFKKLTTEFNEWNKETANKASAELRRLAENLKE